MLFIELYCMHVYLTVIDKRLFRHPEQSIHLTQFYSQNPSNVRGRVLNHKAKLLHVDNQTKLHRAYSTHIHLFFKSIHWYSGLRACFIIDKCVCLNNPNTGCVIVRIWHDTFRRFHKYFWIHQLCHFELSLALDAAGITAVQESYLLYFPGSVTCVC
jgi:hypothetical protein